MDIRGLLKMITIESLGEAGGEGLADLVKGIFSKTRERVQTRIENSMEDCRFDVVVQFLETELAFKNQLASDGIMEDRVRRQNENLNPLGVLYRPGAENWLIKIFTILIQKADTPQKRADLLNWSVDLGLLAWRGYFDADPGVRHRSYQRYVAKLQGVEHDVLAQWARRIAEDLPVRVRQIDHQLAPVARAARRLPGARRQPGTIARIFWA